MQIASEEAREAAGVLLFQPEISASTTCADLSNEKHMCKANFKSCMFFKGEPTHAGETKCPAPSSLPRQEVLQQLHSNPFESCFLVTSVLSPFPQGPSRCLSLSVSSCSAYAAVPPPEPPRSPWFVLCLHRCTDIVCACGATRACRWVGFVCINAIASGGCETRCEDKSGSDCEQHNWCTYWPGTGYCEYSGPYFGDDRRKQ